MLRDAKSPVGLGLDNGVTDVGKIGNASPIRDTIAAGGLRAALNDVACDDASRQPIPDKSCDTIARSGKSFLARTQLNRGQFDERDDQGSHTASAPDSGSWSGRVGGRSWFARWRRVNRRRRGIDPHLLCLRTADS